MSEWKVAVIGSRCLTVENLGQYLPEGVTEIVSGGARGIDACARAHANENGLTITEFTPDYKRYNRGAPLKRNEQIVDYADEVIAFWDGVSKGTKYVIDRCRQQGKPVAVYQID